MATQLSPFAQKIFEARYQFDRTTTKKETWEECSKRVCKNVCDKIFVDPKIIENREFIPGGRYLAAAGREFNQYNNCFLFRAGDSREGWGELFQDVSVALMTGGGVGVEYSDLRKKGAIIARAGGYASGPIPLIRAVDEIGRQVRFGGERRSAIWAGLDASHPDASEFIRLKSGEDRAKIKEVLGYLPMDHTNISLGFSDLEQILLDGSPQNLLFHDAFLLACQYAEPGFSFNFNNPRESLRNACTEVTSEDDGDKCNLGTIWLNRVKDQKHLRDLIWQAVPFLLQGGVNSTNPSEKIRETGAKNNRIGLGIGGFAHWLMLQGMPYEVTPELRKLLEVYAEETDNAAAYFARKLGLEIPKATRSLAPNGTIGILAESTTSIEPLYAAAYIREFIRDGKRVAQYVVDPVARDISPVNVFDSSDISFEQRIRFQADVQDFVDMAISSTCNMDSWGSFSNNEGNVRYRAEILLKYAHRLRGFTVYPDGAIAGQPLKRVSLKEALGKESLEWEPIESKCLSGVCGS